MMTRRIFVFLLCILLWIGAVAQAESLPRFADLWADQCDGISPDRMELSLLTAESQGVYDLLPTEANPGERSERTADFWALYDALCALDLYAVDASQEVAYEYELTFSGEEGGQFVVRLSPALNTLDLFYKTDEMAEPALLGRYVPAQRDLQTEAYDRLGAYIEKYEQKLAELG